MKKEYKLEKQIFFREKYNNSKGNKSLNVNIDEALQNDKFLEQLLVSSKPLYETILKYKNNANEMPIKEKRHLKETVNKYYLRSKFRNTPFGLFSGVGAFEQNNYSGKLVKLGYRWIYNLYFKIVNKYPEKFEYFFENSLDTTNEKIYFFNQEDGNKKEFIQINKTKLIDDLRNYCLRPRKYSEIESFIYNKYIDSGIDKKYVETYLLTLIKNKIIIPNCIPSANVSSKNCLKMLSSIASKLGLIELYDNLNDLALLITQYERTKIGEGIELYNNILNVMQKIDKVSKEDLDVDFYINKPSISAEKIKKFEIEEMMDILSKICLPRDPLYTYTFDFIDKFGTNTEVPLGVLVNKNTGIGFPKKDDKNSSLNKEAIDKIEKYFENKIEKSIIKNKAVQIEESDVIEVQNLEKKLELNLMFPLATDLCLTIDNYDQVQISSVQGSDSPNSMIGRFRKLDSEKTNDYFRKNFDKVDICDINAIPIKLEYGNLTNNNHYTDYELSVGSYGTKKQVKFNDILVGCKGDKLYLRQKGSERKTVFVDNNMLNDELKYPVIKLLLDISNQATNWWYYYPWTKCSLKWSYIPEIDYKNIIVQPAIWNFVPTILENLDDKAISFSDFQSQLKKFQEDFEVPRVIYYVVADNKIPVVLDDEGSVYQLYKMWIKSDRTAIRLEKLMDKTLKNDYHDEEIVCTLTRIRDTSNKLELEGKFEYKCVLPSNYNEGWIYTEIIFSDNSARVAFLKSHIKKLNDLVKSEVEKVFFIQYETDKGLPTIRYRVKVSSDYYRVMGIIDHTLIKEIAAENIKDFNFCNYFPEVYRYGGYNLISTCESIFDLDSQLAFEAYTNLDTVNREALLVYSAIDFVLSGNNDVLTFAKKLETYDKKAANKWLRENKDKIKSFSSNSDINSILNARRTYESQVMNSSELTSVKKDELLQSLLHMNANRIIGVDRMLESKLLYAAGRLIMNMVYKRLNKSKK